MTPLSKILANAGISLFYLSTSNTDFILVPSKMLDAAINALKKSFTVDVESYGEELVENNELDPFFKINQNFFEFNSKQTIFKASEYIPPCTLISEKIQLCSSSRENYETSAYAILKIIFFCPEPNHFWSISLTEDEMSLLIPEQYISYFPSNCLNIYDIWTPIQRFKKTSYSEVGVVAALSTAISKVHIPILYVSTFLSAFIFIQSKNESAAILCLESQKFTVQKKF